MSTSVEYVWWDDPLLVARLGDYCDQDVVTETELDGLAPPLSESERRVWILDQTINDRGVKLDRAAIEHAIKVRDHAKAMLDIEMAKVTGGAVKKCSQTKALVEWIRSLGVKCDSIAKDKQAGVMDEADEVLGDLDVASDAPNVVRQAITLRADAGRTSTAKYTAMLHTMCRDDRARGLFQYHGASSGRWAGRLWQPHNLYRVDPERDGSDISLATDVLLRHDVEGAHDMLRMLFGSAMAPLAKTLRNMIIAEPGHTLKGCDLSNIEGRLAAWFGGEQWKLDAFGAYDAGLGADLYCVAYGRAFGEDPAEVKRQKAKRQIGKVMELALGYQGSVGSFISMGKNYGLNPGDLVPIIRTVSFERFAEWCNKYAKAPDKHGLPLDQWAAVKTIVQGWREQHAGIVQGWWDLQDAAIEATANPGQIVHTLNGHVAYVSARGFLWCRLPSGRVLSYCKPRVVLAIERWIDMPDGSRVLHNQHLPEEWAALIAQGGVEHMRERRRVDYDGYDGEKKRWGSFTLYGGMQFNHIVQGTARDVLVDGMFRAEAAGYPIVMHVHDEVLAESEAWHGSGDELAAIMSTNPAWLPGCPLAAAGWDGPRYAK